MYDRYSDNSVLLIFVIVMVVLGKLVMVNLYRMMNSMVNRLRCRVE